MTNHVLLNSVEHKDIKIITERSEKYGDDIWYAPTFVREFSRAQAHYPILFQKSAEDEYKPVALFGFKNKENLFLADSKWNAGYIPLSVQRLPFLIGFQDVTVDGVTEKQRVVTLDMDSPRVNKEVGVDLFLEYGGNSQYLENIADILETLHQGLQENTIFVNLLEKNKLIEPVTFDIELKDGTKNQLIGFYTINEDVLSDLNDEVIVELHHKGFLKAIYLMIASLVHIKDLIDRKNHQVLSSV